MRPTALFDAAERLVLAEGTQHTNSKSYGTRLGELTLFWKVGSAMATVQKTDLRTGHGFGLCSVALYRMPAPI